MMTLAAPDDTVFIEQARLGDRAAFGELVKRYQRRAYAVAYSLVGNRDDAMEIAQDSFVKAYRAMGGFDAALPFYPWLYRIIRNTSLNHIKKRSRRGESSLDGLMESGTDFASATRGPSDAAGSTELRAQLARCMQTLSDPHREILSLRHVEELSYEEIARVLEVPKGTVMSRLHAARRALRDAMTQTGTTFGNE
jgi:RNA polymerase sigma-70 factor (ECF subfamily)